MITVSKVIKRGFEKNKKVREIYILFMEGRDALWESKNITRVIYCFDRRQLCRGALEDLNLSLCELHYIQDLLELQCALLILFFSLYCSFPYEIGSYYCMRKLV